ncbi:hypothetical protein PsYK624_048520 [Phanerochaete sordida]|uniref:Ubiquitin 3 binding protein But2 C-terminal domain-containing protein n=1 Tax=Phanerochaete sordida TaxID=48140 RepID=A0A9P3LCD5_9APHY|nr:hypothetical protein PsYK624_048520 [Phanerochaete sordida]
MVQRSSVDLDSVPLIPAQDGGLQRSRDLDEELATAKGSSRSLCDSLFAFACVGTICTSLLSIVLFSIGISQQPPVASPFAQYEGQALRRPNAYANLEAAFGAGDLFADDYAPFTNFPDAVFQFKASDRSRRMWEDDRAHMTPAGSVYPDDRHIVANQTVSTLVQFRFKDYGMQRCFLNASVPLLIEKFDPAITLAEPSVLDVWELDTDMPIARYVRGSRDFAPRRRRLFTTLLVRANGQDVSGEFVCKSNELLTLELACSPSVPSCHVDFWQDRRIEPAGGIFLTQLSSVV